MSINLCENNIILTFEGIEPMRVSNENFPIKIISSFNNKLKTYNIIIHKGGMQLNLISARKTETLISAEENYFTGVKDSDYHFSNENNFINWCRENEITTTDPILITGDLYNKKPDGSIGKRIGVYKKNGIEFIARIW